MCITFFSFLHTVVCALRQPKTKRHQQRREEQKKKATRIRNSNIIYFFFFLSLSSLLCVVYFGSVAGSLFGLNFLSLVLVVPRFHMNGSNFFFACFTQQQSTHTEINNDRILKKIRFLVWFSRKDDREKKFALL